MQVRMRVRLCMGRVVRRRVQREQPPRAHAAPSHPDDLAQHQRCPSRPSARNPAWPGAALRDIRSLRELAGCKPEVVSLKTVSSEYDCHTSTAFLQLLSAEPLPRKLRGHMRWPCQHGRCRGSSGTEVSKARTWKASVTAGSALAAQKHSRARSAAGSSLQAAMVGNAQVRGAHTARKPIAEPDCAQDDGSSARGSVL